MSIEIITKSGKKIGRISDESGGRDTIIIDDKEVSLEDAYASEDVKNSFNSQVKNSTNDTGKD